MMNIKAIHSRNLLKTLLSALKFDITFQARHGFYYVYIVLSLLYILILSFISRDFKEIVGTFIIFSDPVMIGFFFIGAIVLLEKDQDIYSGLFITPYRLYQYFLAKIFSLTFLAVLSSFAIIKLSLSVGSGIYIVLVGICLSSIFFTLVGFFLVAKVKSLNEYILMMPLYMIFFFIPIVELLGIFKSPIFYLIPSKAAFLLIGSLFYQISNTEIIYSILVLLIWIVVFYILAIKRFRKYILHNI